MDIDTPPEFEKAYALIQHMSAQINQALIGQKNIVTQTLAALLAGGHILIEGVPGLGKTLLVRAIARTFSGDYSRIQFTPDLMPADVTGHTLYDPSNGQFTTKKGPVFTNLLLADEINRAPAKTQSALLEVMQEGQVTIEGQSHTITKPFMVLATQNPIEEEGTYNLPEAQLDRFLIKLLIEYPEYEDEQLIVDSITKGQIGNDFDLSALAAIVTPEGLQELQQLCAHVTIDEQVSDYALRIVRATRNAPGIATGSGTRGAIALVRMARAYALLQSRNFVTPDDIKAMALPSLRHRIISSADAMIEGQTNDNLLTALLANIDAPRI